jgi:hypothetical protein
MNTEQFGHWQFCLVTLVTGLFLAGVGVRGLLLGKPTILRSAWPTMLAAVLVFGIILSRWSVPIGLSLVTLFGVSWWINRAKHSANRWMFLGTSHEVLDRCFRRAVAELHLSCESKQLFELEVPLVDNGGAVMLQTSALLCGAVGVRAGSSRTTTPWKLAGDIQRRVKEILEAEPDAGRGSPAWWLFAAGMAFTALGAWLMRMLP